MGRIASHIGALNFEIVKQGKQKGILLKDFESLCHILNSVLVEFSQILWYVFKATYHNCK